MRRPSIFFCQNQINYEIASCLTTKGDWLIFEPGIILHEDQAAKHTQASKWVRSLAKWLIKLGWADRIYVPHHKVISIKLLEDKFSKVAYLDDGLDALRVKPKNFTSQIYPGQEYFTFVEYPDLPTWYDPHCVRKICSLQTLISKQPTTPLTVPEEDFLVIESPNLDVQAIEKYVSGRSVCYLEHRVPSKRLKHVPKEWRRDQFGAYTESIIFKKYAGCVISADTMVSVVLHYLSQNAQYKLLYVGAEVPSLPRAYLENVSP